MAVNRKKKHKNCKSRMNRWCQKIIHQSRFIQKPRLQRHMPLLQNLPEGASAKFCVTGGDDLMGKDPWNNFTQPPNRL